MGLFGNGFTDHACRAAASRPNTPSFVRSWSRTGSKRDSARLPLQIDSADLSRSYPNTRAANVASTSSNSSKWLARLASARLVFCVILNDYPKTGLLLIARSFVHLREPSRRAVGRVSHVRFSETGFEECLRRVSFRVTSAQQNPKRVVNGRKRTKESENAKLLASQGLSENARVC